MDSMQNLYHQLIEAWNSRNAEDMAKLFAEDGEMIGYDGSLASGRSEIYEHLSPIFENHPTAPFIIKVKNVQLLSSETALLRAIAGMIPPGKSELNPDVNTHHTLVAVKRDNKWLIQLFQNTPAKFHGRPELIEQMTNELSLLR
ncbi:SgcJ/EcaC family oxidoreductase [Metabacillus idriensis]|uniref:SgcJ/EcaC family oxidoreductase n=1 Tax=Metabacillus idriensis TaxID=324768 RepID=UPI003D28CF58